MAAAILSPSIRMLLHISMTDATASSNDNFCRQAYGMSELLPVAARFSLNLEECQTSASQEGHCLEPARDC